MTDTLRTCAEAVQSAMRGDTRLRFETAATPERILALLDVVDAAKAIQQGHEWEPEGIGVPRGSWYHASAQVTQDFNDALDRWEAINDD